MSNGASGKRTSFSKPASRVEVPILVFFCHGVPNLQYDSLKRFSEDGEVNNLVGRKLPKP